MSEKILKLLRIYYKAYKPKKLLYEGMDGGKGKIVAFGEAAMFTAQLAGPEKRNMGMNTEIAKENYKLLLNIIHWLDGKLD